MVQQGNCHVLHYMDICIVMYVMHIRSQSVLDPNQGNLEAGISLTPLRQERGMSMHAM
jgi:hypothetical protein